MPNRRNFNPRQDLIFIYNMEGPGWMKGLRNCRVCLIMDPPLAYIGDEGCVRPLFFKKGCLAAKILFVAEAPNYDDTFNLTKGSLTVDPGTDPSGRFFHQCITRELGLKTGDIMVTNSVLCLPAECKGKFPVRAVMRRACSINLRTMINGINPLVVAPLGGEALKALNLIERHGLKLADSVAIPHKWHNRTLFPLYHTGLLARTTRKEAQQMQDFKALRKLMESAERNG